MDEKNGNKAVVTFPLYAQEDKCTFCGKNVPCIAYKDAENFAIFLDFAERGAFGEFYDLNLPISVQLCYCCADGLDPKRYIQLTGEYRSE